MSVRIEGFTVNRNLRVNRTVIVEDGVVHHGIGGHDQLLGISYLVGVAGAATLVGNPQVAGGQETNKLGGVEVKPRAGQERPASKQLLVMGLNVGLLLAGRLVIAAMAVDAGHGYIGMHRFDTDVAGLASARLIR